MDKFGATAPRLRQALGLRAFEDGADGRIHEDRVGAAEGEDGLLLISYPDAARHDLGQAQEDGELEGTRVLELIDD